MRKTTIALLAATLLASGCSKYTISTKNEEGSDLEQPSKATASGRDAHHLSALVHKIYDASVHPERWSEVVAAIAASFDSTKGLLFTPFLAPQHGGLVFPAGIAESALQTWGSSYIDKDIWAQGLQAKRLLCTGATLLDHDIVPREEFLATPFYREFLSTLGIGRVCVGVVFEGAPGLPTTVLSIFRDALDAAFDSTDAEWLKLLTAHVSRGLGLMQRLDTLRLQKTSLLTSFDRLSFGVALLNDNMEVLHLNQAAKSVMSRRDGLVINEHRRLESQPNGPRPHSLSHWLERVKNTPMAAQGHFLEGCRIMRSGGRQLYSLQCAEVLPSSAWATHNETIRFIVFIIDPAALQLPSVDRLTTLFELTEAQAKVALEFSIGGTYKEVARRLLISGETVRSHLKAIYPKTRVNRLADLVRLVLSMAHNTV